MYEKKNVEQNVKQNKGNKNRREIHLFRREQDTAEVYCRKNCAPKKRRIHGIHSALLLILDFEKFGLLTKGCNDLLHPNLHAEPEQFARVVGKQKRAAVTPKPLPHDVIVAR